MQSTPQSLAYGEYARGELKPVRAGSPSALESGHAWKVAPAGPLTLSYAFTPRSLGGVAPVWIAFGDRDREVVRTVLDHVEAVANVRFVEASAGQPAAINYTYSPELDDKNIGGWAFYPGSARGGEVEIATFIASPQWDFYRSGLFLHETLHALGLKHPFSDTPQLADADDTILNTVMSYTGIAGVEHASLSVYPDEPMPLDIEELAALYGPATASPGDTLYDASQGPWAKNFHAIWDSGGIDTLDASRSKAAVMLDLRPGFASDVGARVYASGIDSVTRAPVFVTYSRTVDIAQDTTIENATGSPFNDLLVGNERANLILGGAGDDIIDGRGGSDTIVGGPGIDVVLFDGAASMYVVANKGNTWQVRVAADVDELTSVERLLFDDGALALDVAEAAGTAARLLSTVLGPESVRNPTAVGILIAALDSGKTAHDTALLLLNVVARGETNVAFVERVFANVTGSAPSDATTAALASLIDGGVFTQATFAERVADLPLTADRIDLAGLVEHGLPYLPFAF
ncbi:hypothetical protein [Ramlibacter sp.]|uniref:hypothetical protein n=1 Tax=Ramlibacter sp. TaxID=1917967 RepID=UPI003D11F0F5